VAQRWDFGCTPRGWLRSFGGNGSACGATLGFRVGGGSRGRFATLAGSPLGISYTIVAGTHMYTHDANVWEREQSGDGNGAATTAAAATPQAAHGA
jgi:hypothetical protein